MGHRDLTLPNFQLPRLLDRYPDLPIQMVSTKRCFSTIIPSCPPV
jgi:hypothetical protein